MVFFADQRLGGIMPSEKLWRIYELDYVKGILSKYTLQSYGLVPVSSVVGVNVIISHEGGYIIGGDIKSTDFPSIPSPAIARVKVNMDKSITYSSGTGPSEQWIQYFEANQASIYSMD